MVAWTTTDMGGEVPKTDPRLLGPSSAAFAVNADLTSGPLDGLPAPVLVHDMSALGPPVKKAYRFPLAGFPDNWLPLPSPFSCVVPSPLTNDSLHRVYWTNPPDSAQPGGHWTTLGRIVEGDPSYDLGFIAPPADPAMAPIVSASGGTPPDVVPYVARSYLVTYVDIYEQESSPGVPSVVVEGASDAAWLIQVPLQPTGPVAGKNYPPVSYIRVYRTVAGQSTGAQFYETKDYPATANAPFTNQFNFTDNTFDQYEVGNRALASTAWSPAPAGLDGLISMPGGFMAGFTGNTIHFCEPDRPHAWPATYDIAVKYQIVALALWNQTLMVLTQGFPSTGSGATPASITLSEVQVAEPCISRGSVVSDLLGVYYASQSGLVMLSYFGMQNQTLSLLSKDNWINDLHAPEIIACRHRNQYIAMNAEGTGFLIDYTEARMGLVRLDTFAQLGVLADSVWNDRANGACYMMAGQKVYVLDSTTAPALAWRWRSKIFEQNTPLNLGACRIVASPNILNAPPATATDLSPNSQVGLQGGVNTLFRLFVDGVQRWEKPITRPIDIFRLPSGFKGFEFQFELVSRVPVFRVELASTMKELRGGGAGQ